MRNLIIIQSTYATPSTIGIVYEEELTDFSQAFAPHELVDSDDDVVSVLRASITRFGTAIFAIDSIVPIASA
jgi:hypothetical protein